MKEKISKELKNKFADDVYQLTFEYVNNVIDALVEINNKAHKITDPRTIAQIHKLYKEYDLQITDDIYVKLITSLYEHIPDLESKQIFPK